LREGRVGAVFAILLALSAAGVVAKPTRISPAVAAELTEEAYSVQRLAAEGQLLYESAGFFQRRTWGQPKTAFAKHSWLSSLTSTRALRASIILGGVRLDRERQIASSSGSVAQLLESVN
jgi:hypothetical protein